MRKYCLVICTDRHWMQDKNQHHPHITDNHNPYPMTSFHNYILIITLSLAMATATTAQTEPDIYKEASATYQKHYNAKAYTEVFNMFDESMKEFLPLAETEKFLSGVQTQIGPIKTMEFSGVDNRGFALYKTTFSNGMVLGTNLALSTDSKIIGLAINPWTDMKAAGPMRSQTPMALPFGEEWTVIWGGDLREDNHHHDNPAQKYAIDAVITDENGISYKGQGFDNEDYYCFGKPLMAPCAGEVVTVVDGIPDNRPGRMNPYFVPGNTVVIKTANNEYLYFAHFKKHSIVVKEGQQVEKGTLLGLCGNSGNSSEAHLHFHIQDAQQMHEATAVKGFFSDIIVNGDKVEEHAPVRNDKVRNGGGF